MAPVEAGVDTSQFSVPLLHKPRGELSPYQVRLKLVDGGLADIVHRLPPLEALPLFDLGHRLVLLGAFGPVIELGGAEGHLERAVPHELFEHLQ